MYRSEVYQALHSKIVEYADIFLCYITSLTDQAVALLLGFAGNGT